jgi:hypothetical protein
VVDVDGPFDQVFFGLKRQRHRRRMAPAYSIIAYAMCLVLAEIDRAK